MSSQKVMTAKLVAFTENTTLHGLKQVGESSGKVYRRVIWLLLLLSMLGLLLFYFMQGLTRYLSYPTVIKLNLFQNTSLAFPTVTICNNNMIREPYLFYNPLVGNVTGVHSPEMSRIPTINLSDASVIEDMKAIVYNQIFYEGSHRVDEMFEFCFWDDLYFKCSNGFEYVFTDTHGVCYSFNRKGTKISYIPGNLYGLEVILNMEQYLYGHMATSPGAGLKVVIHEVGSLPILQENAILVSPGVASEIKLFRKKSVLLPAPYEGPGCYNGDEYKTLSGCKVLCHSKYLAKMCNCQYLPLANVLKGYRNCSLYDYHVCVVLETEVYMANVALEAECGCLHHCTEVYYDITPSQMLFPSQVAATYYNIEMEYNVTIEEYRENTLHLKIYYGNMLTTITEQVGSFTFANFSAEMGGYLGLCLGASLLTLTELLEFLIVLAKSLCCRRNKISGRKINTLEL